MWKIFDLTDTQAVSELDGFVASHDNCHFMQTSLWAGVKKYWSWRGISVYQQNRIVASLGILIRRLPFGFSLLYAPRGPVCDRNHLLIWYELMDALKHLAKEQHAILFQMDPDEPDSNSPFRNILRQLGFTEKNDEGFGNIQPQHVFRLLLKGRSHEEVFCSFGAKTRYNIGLALRKGISVREYSGAEPIPERVLTDFYTLMQTTGERDCFYIRSLDYFSGLMKSLQENARIYVAYYDECPIAGSIAVFCGNKAWYLYGASANEYRNTMPNYLLQWLMIRQAIDRGCDVYDFRGVPGNLTKNDPLYGLYRFKKGFGGTYVKFTGLFTYTFRPTCSKLFKLAMRIRRKLKPTTRRR